MKAENMPDWLKKCITCKYAYKKQNDADCVYCRRKDGKCKYEAYEARLKAEKFAPKEYDE